MGLRVAVGMREAIESSLEFDCAIVPATEVILMSFLVFVWELFAPYTCVVLLYLLDRRVQILNKTWTARRLPREADLTYEPVLNTGRCLNINFLLHALVVGFLCCARFAKIFLWHSKLPRNLPIRNHAKKSSHILFSTCSIRVLICVFISKTNCELKFLAPNSGKKIQLLDFNFINDKQKNFASESRRSQLITD